MFAARERRKIGLKSPISLFFSLLPGNGLPGDQFRRTAHTTSLLNSITGPNERPCKGRFSIATCYEAASRNFNSGRTALCSRKARRTWQLRLGWRSPAPLARNDRLWGLLRQLCQSAHKTGSDSNLMKSRRRLGSDSGWGSELWMDLTFRSLFRADLSLSARQGTAMAS